MLEMRIPPPPRCPSTAFRLPRLQRSFCKVKGAGKDSEIVTSARQRSGLSSGGYHALHTVRRADGGLRRSARSCLEGPSPQVCGRTRRQSGGSPAGALAAPHFRRRARTSSALSPSACAKGQTDPGTSNRRVRSALNIKPSSGLGRKGLLRRPDHLPPSLRARRTGPSVSRPPASLQTCISFPGLGVGRPLPGGPAPLPGSVHLKPNLTSLKAGSCLGIPGVLLPEAAALRGHLHI